MTAKIATAPAPLPTTSHDLTALIETLRDDLTKVNATIDIIGKPAIQRAEEITAAIDAANEQLAVILANEAEAARKVRLAGIGDISITVAYPSNYRGNLLRANFTIEYTRLQYDMRCREPLPQHHKLIGFGALPGDVFQYLLEVRPEVIPTEITDLAPGDPLEAFRRYFLAQRRGRLDTYAAAA